MKALHIFLFLLLGCSGLKAQLLNVPAYEPNAVRTWGVGLAGWMYQSYDDQILYFAGGPYFYKKDTLGNPIWSWQVFTHEDTALHVGTSTNGIVQLPDTTNILVISHFGYDSIVQFYYSPGPLGEDTTGHYYANQVRFFQLVKTDKNGKKIWEKLIDAPYKDNYPFMTGSYSAPFLFSNGDIGIYYNFVKSPAIAPPYGACWESTLMRIDTSGQLKNYHVINPMFPDTGADPSLGIRRVAQVRSIVPTPDNGAYAMMNYGISGKDTLRAVKIDSTGKVEWMRMPPTNPIFGYSNRPNLSLDCVGSDLLCFFGIASSLQEPIRGWKVNAAGETCWFKTYPTDSTCGGSLGVIGDFSLVSGDTIMIPLYLDQYCDSMRKASIVFFALIDTSGNPICQSFVNRGNSDALFFDVNIGGTVYGAYLEATLEGGVTKRLMAAFRPLCHKLIVSREDFATIRAEAKVYPNPFQNKIHLENIPARSQWQILDLSGKQLRSGKTVLPDDFIEPNLPMGMYILQFPEYSLSFKIVQE